MKEKLMAAVAQSTVSQQLKQTVRIVAVTVRYTSQDSFEREMERRRYGR